jgi:hypothetical protein
VRRMGLVKVTEQVVDKMRKGLRSNHASLTGVIRSLLLGRAGPLLDPPMVQ